MFGLPGRRDAQIEGGANRHGHGRRLLTSSSAGPEQFVKEVAEPRLDYVELGVHDRNALGPIIGDDPAREVVLRWPADARPRLKPDVEVIGQDAQAEARSGHPHRIAPRRSEANDPSLSWNALLPPGNPAGLADGAFGVDSVGISAGTYGTGLVAGGWKVQLFQPIARRRRPRFSFAIRPLSLLSIRYTPSNAPRRSFPPGTARVTKAVSSHCRN
jgi:hypothetical protein